MAEQQPVTEEPACGSSEHIPEHTPEHTPEAEGTNLTRAISSTSSTESAKVDLPFRISKRSNSHTLLSATNALSSLRKGVQASTESTNTTMDRPSISMPPPSTKPTGERRLSPSLKPGRRSEDTNTSRGEYSSRIRPAALLDGLYSDENPEPDSKPLSSAAKRLSLISVHSIGSTIFGVTANGSSIASSSHESAKGTPQDEPQTHLKSPAGSTESAKGNTAEEPLSPRKSPAGPTAGPPTTATDRTPVVTSPIPPNASASVISPPALVPNEPSPGSSSSSNNVSASNKPSPNKDGTFLPRAARPARSVSVTRRFSASTGTSTAGSEPEGMLYRDYSKISAADTG